MSREITSHKATEKFSFIYSLTISHDVDRDLKEIISVQERQSVPKTEIEDWIRELKNSSALVKRPKTSHSSSLVISEPATISDQWYELSLNPDVSELDLLSIASDTNYDASSFPQKNPRYLDKIFFTAACGYLVFVLWWLMGYKNGQLSNMFAFMTHNRQETISQADAEFLSYMKQSLAIIDRNLLAQTEKTPTSSQKDASETIVYVPVYTATSNTQAQNLAPIPLPPPPSPIPTANIPIAKITPPPPPKSQLKNPVTISTEAIPSPPPSEVTAAVKPAPSYTLVGLMEFGAKPTAMFKGKGGTKRIIIGQKIDDSGWKLEAIQERNVVISRQGQSRTINIGERF